MNISSSKEKQKSSKKQQHANRTIGKQGSNKNTTTVITSNSRAASSVTDEQNTYSSILSIGRKLGLAAISISLAIYATGLVPPRVPVESLPKYWGLSSSEFMQVAGIKAGWSWVTMYQYSDMLNYFGIAILGGVSAICYMAIVPSLVRKKDYTFALIATMEVLVLLLAASGLINAGE